MSIVENNTDLSDYDQELIYHREEASYHLDHHVKSMIEAESHWKKLQEHEKIYNKLWLSKNREVINA